MTNGPTIWKTLQRHSPKRQWIPLAQVFAIVESHVTLDAEDLAHFSTKSKKPRWKTNVRQLLRIKERAGSIRARRREKPNFESP